MLHDAHFYEVEYSLPAQQYPLLPKSWPYIIHQRPDHWNLTQDKITLPQIGLHSNQASNIYGPPSIVSWQSGCIPCSIPECSFCFQSSSFSQQNETRPSPRTKSMHRSDSRSQWAVALSNSHDVSIFGTHKPTYRKPISLILVKEHKSQRAWIKDTIPRSNYAYPNITDENQYYSQCFNIMTFQLLAKYISDSTFLRKVYHSHQMANPLLMETRLSAVHIDFVCLPFCTPHTTSNSRELSQIFSNTWCNTAPTLQVHKSNGESVEACLPKHSSQTCSSKVNQQKSSSFFFG